MTVALKPIPSILRTMPSRINHLFLAVLLSVGVVAHQIPGRRPLLQAHWRYANTDASVRNNPNSRDQVRTASRDFSRCRPCLLPNKQSALHFCDAIITNSFSLPTLTYLFAILVEDVSLSHRPRFVRVADRSPPSDI